MSIDWSQLKDLLVKLGESGGEIAQFLKAQECKGYISEPNSCPIAVYLSKETGQPAFVSADCIYLNKASDPSYLTEEEIPIAVEDFIFRFDDGEYPELLKME